MTDRRDTNINIDREPTTRVYTTDSNGGMIAAVVIVVAALAVLAFVFLRPGIWSGPAETNVRIENPAVPIPPADSPVTPAPQAPAPEAPAPAPEPAPATP